MRVVSMNKHWKNRKKRWRKVWKRVKDKEFDETLKRKKRNGSYASVSRSSRIESEYSA